MEPVRVVSGNVTISGAYRKLRRYLVAASSGSPGCVVSHHRFQDE